ncbi:hypothetical protein PoB_004678700 [Plakobranchus ocellatus]|uniref:Uncharacterized protein n=1 Tax=Plakobranchus ocellatus TaxID=259542 RepID=A0AAV4BMX5_9GAST|nr:hypothetical protein PoB_004678700 [Plakobranchus ocellatus]
MTQQARWRDCEGRGHIRLAWAVGGCSLWIGEKMVLREGLAVIGLYRVGERERESERGGRENRIPMTWLYGGKERGLVSFSFKASPEEDDLRLSGPPANHGASSGAQICDRWGIADLRPDSLSTDPPTPRKGERYKER